MDKEVNILRKTAQGFTLIELLVVIAILVILATVVYLVINPFEFQKRGRDATRLSDLANLQTVINLALQESNGSSQSTLCALGGTNCNGSTNPATSATRNIDGTGWVKVNISSQKAASFPVLPIDPVNNTTYNYRYVSDGNGWEIDTVLESQQYQGKAVTDGGNCDTRYETGTNLTLQGC